MNSDKPGFAKKNQALKKNVFFSPRCSHETQASPALQKNNCSGSQNSFFRMHLVKSANSTSLPRLSLRQIVQMHAIHN